MRKIIQVKINQEFLPASPATFDVGEVLEFDCYIKRFNDYVVVIEAGTTVTEALLEKIGKHRHIYIRRDEGEKLRALVAAKKEKLAVKEEVTADVDALFEGLQEALNSCENSEHQMDLLYKNATELMRAFFAAGKETIPIRHIERFGALLIDLTKESDYRMSDFLESMPNTYDDATHNVNVSFLSVLLGRELAMSEKQLYELAVAAILHDCGKVKIDPNILKKDAALSIDEYEAVQEHPVYSAEIAKYNGVTLPNVLSAIRCHHEKLDGSGYPDGLTGNKIPVMAQIVGICDIFDAMTSDHNYRARYSSFDALKVMKQEMNGQLNMEFVNTFITLLK